jgi:hypothetical protein
MAAGLGFKTFTTGDVLTAGDTNGYLMQGVWVFADAAARTAAVASPQEGNISYLKDTNSTEYYSGSAWVSIGGASGGMTLLSTTTLSGATTTISVAATGYVNLFVQVTGLTQTTAANNTMTINGVTTSSYSTATEGVFGASANCESYGVRSGVVLNPPGVVAQLETSPANAYDITIYNVNSTVKKNVFVNGSFTDSASTQTAFTATVNASAITSAVTSVEFRQSAGTFTAGTVKIYGVK